MKKKLRADLFDSRITSIVGQDIYYIHAPQPKNIYIEYLFYNEADSDKGSNKTFSKIHYIQVDIFSKGDFTDLEEAIKTVMNEKGYEFQTCANLYEDDTLLYHCALRYTYKEFLNK